MAGAAKKRQQRERKDVQARESEQGSSSNEKSSPSPPSGYSPTQAAPGKTSPPSRYDGNRDPAAARSRSESQSSQGRSQQTVVAPMMGGTITNKNLDLGGLGAAMMEGVSCSTPSISHLL